ncbi:MAG: hypothetical protein PUD80_03225 [Firmicutes bacterium]|nr:hypothetical protein [Bacillota bacterium]
MKSKALKRQLLAAVAMVLVAAVALGSSTYAWFVQSSKVTANGMNVQATAEGGIEISNSEKTTWGTSAATTNSKAVLYPTSTSDLTKWYHAQADKSVAHNAKAGTYTTLTLDGTGTDTTSSRQYYQVNEFTIRATAGTTATDLKIDKVTASGQADTTALDKSLRVAIKIGDANPVFFSPASGDTSYSVWSGTGDTPTVAVTSNDGQSQVDPSVASVDSTGVLVKVYVYYEGEDTQHKSENVTAGTTIDNMTVQIDFSATVS